MVMYYNRDLFDRYNVPYPQIDWTWDDFLNAALALRDPRANIFGYAPGQDAPLWLPGQELFDPLIAIYQHGGRLVDDLQHPTRATFDDPLTIEAMEWYAGLFIQHDVAPTPLQARETFGAGGLIMAIDQGQVGMWSGMLSVRGGQSSATRWRMRWGMAPLPRDAQSATLALIEGYAISSKTPHPEACWKWIAFLSDQVPYRQVPARRSLAASADYERLVGKEVAAVARATVKDALLFSLERGSLRPRWRTFIGALEAIINERTTPEGAMIEAQRRIESR
jgi:multiple sugar transport system substrate-binding protein